MKKIILNPTKKEEKGATLLNPEQTMDMLVERIFDKKYPVITKADHIRKLLGFTGFENIAMNTLSGREVANDDDAKKFIDFIGQTAFKSKFWILKVFKGIVERDKNINAVYYTKVPAQSLNEAQALLRDDIADLFVVEAREPMKTTNPTEPKETQETKGNTNDQP